MGESVETAIVLVVTADTEVLAACERELPTRADVSVSTATTVAEAVEVLSGPTPVECLVSGHRLPDADVTAFFETVRARDPTVPLVVLTDEANEKAVRGAISSGVTEYLVEDRHDDAWDLLAGMVTDSIVAYRDRGDRLNTAARRETALDAATDMVAIVRDGRFVSVNQAGLDLLGVDAKPAIVGEPVDGAISVENGPDFVERLASVQGGDPLYDRIEGRLDRADGASRPVDITATRGTWDGSKTVILVVREVSDESADQVERGLESHLKNRAIEQAPFGVTIADASRPDNPVVYASEGFQRVTGYPEAEILGRNCRFLQGEDTDPETVGEMREAIDAEQPVTVEVRNYRRDGTAFWNRVTIVPLSDADGDVTHYLGFQEDVTDRKESEEGLRRFSRTVEVAGHAIYMTDPDGRITYANRAFEDTTGYERDEVEGETPRILNSGEMSEAYFAELWETIGSGEVWEEEITDRRKDGNLYHAHQTIAPVTDVHGETEGYVAIQTDVTDRKEREAQLHQYERAVEGATDLIAAIDDEYQYLFANEAYREFHSLDAETVRETTLQSGIGPDMFETAEPYVERALDGESVRYQMTRTCEDRPDRTFDIEYYPLEDDRGEIRGAVATMRDVTDRLERERHIQALDRMLRHNIRNELNVIEGRTEMILDRVPEEVATVARPIQDSAERILAQADKEREIVDLLSGPTTRTSIRLADAVTDIVERLEAEYPDADVSAEVPDDLTVRTVPEVERAIEELLENAVVHGGDAPEVLLTAHCDEETIEISVADDGPGVPERERRVIAGSAETEPLLHSHGMGLWLARQIVTRAHGTLGFEDRDPQGSLVTITLPRVQ